MVDVEDDRYLLSWSEFNTNLSTEFNQFLCDGELVDVTLVSEGQLLKAHRLVLSACSPVFRQMFTKMPANQHAFVFLKDVAHATLKDLIQFMYFGEVSVEYDSLPLLIDTANALQIKGLVEFKDVQSELQTSFTEATEGESSPPKAAIQLPQKRYWQSQATPEPSKHLKIATDTTFKDIEPQQLEEPKIQQHSQQMKNLQEVSNTQSFPRAVESMLCNGKSSAESSSLIIGEWNNKPDASSNSENRQPNFTRQTNLKPRTMEEGRESSKDWTEPVVRFEKSGKGNRLINIDGYKFYKSSVSNQTAHYRCRLYTALGCQARCHVKKDCEEVQLTDLCHNHGVHTQTIFGNKNRKLRQNETVVKSET